MKEPPHVQRRRPEDFPDDRVLAAASELGSIGHEGRRRRERRHQTDLEGNATDPGGPFSSPILSVPCELFERGDLFSHLLN